MAHGAGSEREPGELEPQQLTFAQRHAISSTCSALLHQAWPEASDYAVQQGTGLLSPFVETAASGRSFDWKEADAIGFRLRQIFEEP